MITFLYIKNMRIGLTELLVIVIIAIALIKPDKLGEYAKTAGRITRKFLNETKDLNESANEIKETIESATEPISSITEEVKKEFKGE